MSGWRHSQYARTPCSGHNRTMHYKSVLRVAAHPAQALTCRCSSGASSDSADMKEGGTPHDENCGWHGKGGGGDGEDCKRGSCRGRCAHSSRLGACGACLFILWRWWVPHMFANHSSTFGRQCCLLPEHPFLSCTMSVLTRLRCMCSRHGRRRPWQTLSSKSLSPFHLALPGLCARRLEGALGAVCFLGVWQRHPTTAVLSFPNLDALGLIRCLLWRE